MATQTGGYDLKAAKAAHDEAAQKATSFIFKTTGHDAWVCDEDAGPNPTTGEAYGPNATKPTTGWRIGSVFEMVKQGATWFKLWVENNMAKLRVGQESSSHVLLDSNGMSVYKGAESAAQNKVASIGSVARIGSLYGPHTDIGEHGSGFYLGDDYDEDSNFADELFYTGYDSNEDFVYSRRCFGRIVEATYPGDGIQRPVVFRTYPDGADLMDDVTGSGTYTFTIDGGIYTIDAGTGTINFIANAVQWDYHDLSIVGHTHTIADTTGLQTALDGKAASSHNHAAGDINSGTLDVARGGTGAATAAANKVFAGPSSGDAAAPSFRALAAADIPSLAASKIGSGTLALARGGTASDNTSRSINTFFAGPSSGDAGNASWRKIAAADVPNLNASKITAGTLDDARVPTLDQTKITPIYYQARGSGDKSLTAGTITQITLVTTGAQSSGSGLSIASGGIKIATAGKYRITAAAYVTNTASGSSGLGTYVKKAASSGAFSSASEILSAVDHYSGGNAGAACAGPKIVSCAANDIVYLAARSIGAAGTCDCDNAMTYLLVERLS